MLYFAAILWFLSLVVLTGYHVFLFRIRGHEGVYHDQAIFEGVSVVIAVKNGSDRLIGNLEKLLAQDYPEFEIIIVDDHSDQDEKEKLEKEVKRSKKIFFFHNQGKPGKKKALTVGIQHANHQLILCTDADCQPLTPGWIKSMVVHRGGNEMVLGYSPYTYTRGLLNLFVRFETVMTAIQYLSWAMIGKPYMGVGRNMLYPRKLFQQENPYQDQQNIPYGDDDLWVQRAARLTKVNVNIDPSSFVNSDPPHSWRSWFKQKHRHLSAGHHYGKKSWWQPGAYGLALSIHWFLIPFLLLGSTMNWIFVLFLIGLCIRYMVYGAWTKKLGDRDTFIWYPFLELGYALYLTGMGLFTLVVKKKAWN